MVARLIPCCFVLWAIVPLRSAPSQEDPPPQRPDAKAAEAGADDLDDAFGRIRALAAEVPFERDRYRRDPTYRAAYRREVAERDERLRRSAVAFLAKRRGALQEGIGIYYRAMALRWSDDTDAAVGSFRSFFRAEREHPRRLEVLVDWAEVALERARTADLSVEGRRIRAVKTVLRRIRREAEDIEDAALAERVDAVRRQLVSIELRAKFHIVRTEILEERNRRLVAALVEADAETWSEERATLLVDNVPLEDMLEDESARRAWSKVSPTLNRMRRTKVGAFFRANRDALESDAGALIAARAMRLARDPRASAYFERSLTVARTPRSLSETALEWAVFALDELDDPDLARRTLVRVFVEDLDDAREPIVDGLRARLKRFGDLATKRKAAVGRAWSGVLRVGGDPSPAPGRSARVWFFFAPWSAPSRAALVALDGVTPRLGVEAIGVSPAFGFGWRVQTRVAGDDGERLDGQPVASPLAADAEAALLRAFREAGRIRMPLVLSDGATAARLGIDSWPTAVAVGPDGTIRAVLTGAKVAEIERAVEAMREPKK